MVRILSELDIELLIKYDRNSNRMDHQNIVVGYTPRE